MTTATNYMMRGAMSRIKGMNMIVNKNTLDIIWKIVDTKGVSANIRTHGNIAYVSLIKNEKIERITCYGNSHLDRELKKYLYS